MGICEEGYHAPCECGLYYGDKSDDRLLDHLMAILGEFQVRKLDIPNGASFLFNKVANQNRQVEKVIYLKSLNGLLRVEEAFDGSMLFAAIPDRTVAPSPEIPEVTVEIESFVRMNKLSKEVQDEIREYLGLK